MENVTRTLDVQTLGQILAVATVSAVSTSTEATSTEATSTEATSTEATSTETTISNGVTVETIVATEEVGEGLRISIALDETKLEGELAEIWSAVKSGEININELFVISVSFRNNRFSFAITPRVATV